MKKVLLIIIASLFSFASANAVEISVGIGYNNAVFAAEGKEDGYNESGTLSETTVEYGAFDDSYGSIYLEAGNEMGSIGISYSETIKTPSNVNEANFPGTGNATSRVSADFENFVSLYGILKIPFAGLYAKAGISQADVIINETQRSGNTYPDTDINGYIVGLGIQHNADNGFGVRAEIQGHTFDDVSVNNGVATTGNHNKITISEMIGLTGQISILKTF